MYQNKKFREMKDIIIKFGKYADLSYRIGQHIMVFICQQNLFTDKILPS